MTIEWRRKKHSSYTLFDDCLISFLLLVLLLFLQFDIKAKRDHLPLGSRWNTERMNDKKEEEEEERREELNELIRVKRVSKRNKKQVK